MRFLYTVGYGERNPVDMISFIYQHIYFSLEKKSVSYLGTFNRFVLISDIRFLGQKIISIVIQPPVNFLLYGCPLVWK